jgi:O-antigen/teichoic acid export membrane protein
MLMGMQRSRKARVASDATPPLVAAGRDGQSSGAYYFGYIVANIAPRAAMFVLMIALTRTLPIAQYGLFALAVAIGEILDMVASNWIRFYLLRTEAAAADLGSDAVSRSLVLAVVSTALAVVATFFVVPLVDEPHARELIIATVAYICAFAILRTTLTLTQLLRQHRLYLFIESVRACGILIGSGLALVYRQSDFLPACLALAAITAVASLAGLAICFSQMPCLRFPRGGYLAAVKYGMPFAVATSLMYTLGWLDRLILNYFSGPAQVAIYAAAFAVARQPVDLFVAPLNNYVFPMLVRAHSGQEEHNAAWLQTGTITSVSIIGFGVIGMLVMFAEPVTTILFPVSYRASATTLIPLIAAGAFCLALKQFVFDNSLHVTGKVWLHVASIVPSAVIGVVASIVMIRLYGELGAAMAYFLAAVIAVVSGAVLSLRGFSFPIPWRYLLAALVATLLACGSSWAALKGLPRAMPIVTLLVGSTVFAAVYLAVLSALGLSVRHLIKTPWAPYDHVEATDVRP